jgi:hypothetical protein
MEFMFCGGMITSLSTGRLQTPSCLSLISGISFNPTFKRVLQLDQATNHSRVKLFAEANPRHSLLPDRMAWFKQYPAAAL